MNASNCHLQKINSIRGFSRILFKFYTILYGLLEFSKQLFLRTSLYLFQNISKWMLSSLSNRTIFFSEYFYSKITKKNKYKETRNAFHHVFMFTFYTVILQKISLLSRLKSRPSLTTLNRLKQIWRSANIFVFMWK